MPLIDVCFRRARVVSFHTRARHRDARQSDYSVSLEVLTTVPRVVLMGVREDVEAAAEKIHEISHEFRETEERWPVEPYQVRWEKGSMTQDGGVRGGGGVAVSTAGMV